MTDVEEWKVIPGYDSHYEASTHGRIRSLWFKNGVCDKPREEPKYLKFYMAEGHYPSVTFRKGQNAICVHRIILETFVGPCPAGYCCGHFDGNKHNNRLDNLSWITYQQNNGPDMKRTGTAMLGSRNHQAKLSDASVVQIRRLWEEGQHSAKSIGLMFGVSPAVAWKVAVRQAWSHVA